MTASIRQATGLPLRLDQVCLELQAEGSEVLIRRIADGYIARLYAARTCSSSHCATIDAALASLEWKLANGGELLAWGGTE